MVAAEWRFSWAVVLGGRLQLKKLYLSIRDSEYVIHIITVAVLMTVTYWPITVNKGIGDWRAFGCIRFSTLFLRTVAERAPWAYNCIELVCSNSKRLFRIDWEALIMLGLYFIIINFPKTPNKVFFCLFHLPEPCACRSFYEWCRSKGATIYPGIYVLVHGE